MNDRERWIVYPLLFLALGASLRDKLLKQTRADQIVCSRMILADSDNRVMAVLTGDGLTFEPGGRGNGEVRANVVNAEGFYQRNQPIAQAVGQQIWRPLFQLFSQLSTAQRPKLKVAPQQGASPKIERSTDEEPSEDGPNPPIEGPSLPSAVGEPGGAS